MKVSITIDVHAEAPLSSDVDKATRPVQHCGECNNKVIHISIKELVITDVEFLNLLKEVIAIK